ncbi:hypothetical protein [Halolamina salina]|uniref:Uncharacterized protein n=1 Tax=Halolamina salina TaxID=1220023 RepID=A0ABD6BAB6_9EURY
MSEGDSTTEVSKWALFKPFKRPLALNLLVPVLGVALWLVTFDQTVEVLGVGGGIAADSTAGRVTRVRATAVANVVYGTFLGVATLSAYGWVVWNLFLSGFSTLYLPNLYFRLRGTPIPDPMFHMDAPLLRYGVNPERIVLLSLAWVASTYLLFFGGAKLLLKHTRWKYWWIPKLPT